MFSGRRNRLKNQAIAGFDPGQGLRSYFVKNLSQYITRAGIFSVAERAKLDSL
jgi:hypothetical protein